jgi:hypothetical protein
MAMTLVSTVTVGSGGAASIEFTSIPQTGTDLLVVFSLRSEAASNNSTLSLNGTSGNGYNRRVLAGDGSSASTASGTDSSTMLASQSSSSNTSNTFSTGEIYVPNYTSTESLEVFNRNAFETNATAAGVRFQIIRRAAAGPITSLGITGNSGDIAQNSTASLYIIS